MSENKDAEMKKQEREQIVELGSDITKSSKGSIYTLTIIGQVEGHMLMPPQNKTTKYEHIIPQLAAIELDERIEGVLIILNTVGGDVEAGLAIAEAISGLSKPTVSLVIGGGHSIGVPIAVSADHSFIASSATMTIHAVFIFFCPPEALSAESTKVTHKRASPAMPVVLMLSPNTIKEYTSGTARLKLSITEVSDIGPFS